MPALLAVLGLHALLFIAWPRQPAAPREAARPVREPAVLRLLWPAPPAPAARPAPVDAAVRRAAPAQAPRRPPPPALQPSRGPILPPTAPATGQAITLLPAEPPASAPRRSEAPLDLRLPVRTGQRTDTPAAAAALDDPRANTARPGWTARLARSLDTRTTEEMQPDGSTRIRRGDDCLLARATRGSQLDPFSDHAKTAPRAVGSCH